MKSNILIIIILFVRTSFASSYLFVQDSTPEIIKRYNYFVNLAEISIIDGDYNEAVQKYNEAFSPEVYTFAVDKYNAAICHVLMENYEQAYSLLKEILQKGYSISNLKNKTIFDSFFLSQWGLKLIDSSRNIVFTFNEDLRKTLDSLFYMDQLFRKNREFGDPYDFFEDTINSIDDSNRIVLEAIIDKHGFPGEQVIGLSESCLIQQPYSIILRHLQQISTGRRRGEVTNVSPLIIDAYHSGRMPLHEASALLELAQRDFGTFSAALVKVFYIPPGGNPFPVPEEEKTKKEWSFLNLGEEELAINEVRIEFGLETIEDFRKKLVFRLDNGTFNFKKIRGGKNTLTTMNKEQYDHVNKNLIPLR
jgi:tetratricopeptide (TPR) repeat protein